MIVEVISASPAEATVIANLMELYLYDFTDLGGPSIGSDGRYGYPWLDAYWGDARREPYLIRADGELAGFALVMERSLIAPELAGYEVSEFFVLRAYRRRGVGEAAAHALFARHPGPWYIGQLADNAPAQTFWRTVVGRYTRGAYREERWTEGERRGVAQTFVSPSVPSHLSQPPILSRSKDPAEGAES
ncbi:MAG: hypothetical protein QOF51_2475 [Chloroflexota bacterium]|nr:hypothetical protein [Chloroflexota bacterium]